MDHKKQLTDILRASRTYLSDLKPSEWAEKNRIMPQGSPFPGPYRYDRTPYFREIVDQLAKDCPARIIVFMKGAQIGASAGVIENGLGWIIDQSPANVVFLSGHTELAEDAMNTRIDEMIDTCGLRSLIRPNAMRKRNQRTGDTSKSKEFPNGSIRSGSASNHKLLRQYQYEIGFIDDVESAKGDSKESGATVDMIEQRFASNESKMKLYFISTPEVKQNSNIEPLYLQGDQRRWMMPCPCCSELIPFEWKHDVEEGHLAGISWKLDAKNKLIEDSVGYVCQICAAFFKETEKMSMMTKGKWVATNVPDDLSYVSFHLSALYATAGMFGWTHYVKKFLQASPHGRDPIAKKMQSFTNLCLGQTWEEKTITTNAKTLLSNTRSYEVGTIPELVSIADGNGKIISLTMACDMGGTVDDGRIDWEIVAWSELGTPYSVDQGSIGTFVNKENTMKHKEDRTPWSYDLKSQRSVWAELTRIALNPIVKDSGGSMIPTIVGIDTGFFEKEAFDYIDSVRDFWCVGVKGKDVFKKIAIQGDKKEFKDGLSRSKLFILEVNRIKDRLAELMTLRWDPHNDDQQPIGFMNFPQPSGGKYSYDRFYKHFESEHRVIENDASGIEWKFTWKKKGTSLQNHFWDVRIYNMALRDIIAHEMCKAFKLKDKSWADFVKVILHS